MTTLTCKMTSSIGTGVQLPMAWMAKVVVGSARCIGWRRLEL